MAEVERRSKPRKIEPKEDEATEPKGHGLVLAAYLVAAIAILELMFIVATFLSNPTSLSNTLYYVVGGTVAVAAILFAWGKLSGRAKG